jgi:cyclic pyranopterin monophosphate synthase
LKPAARMVDVSAKPKVPRRATAEARLMLQNSTLQAIRDKTVEKGDVLEIARTAAILAAKATPQLLPLCHPIPLQGVDVDFKIAPDHLLARVTVRAEWQTGVEMEALTATAIALLTAWDLVKPLEKDADGQYPHARLEGLRVVSKVKG